MNADHVRTINDYLDSGMTKTAWVWSLLAAVPVVMWGINEVRRLFQGEPTPAHYYLTPMVNVSRGPEGFSANIPGGNFGNFGNFGYAIPGALAGAALGGLMGKNISSALLGGALGAGAGYFLPRLMGGAQ
jgi:hypothetical protein